jgi:predicted nucleic acid-binding protein
VAATIVLDASAFLRAAVEERDVARLWIAAVDAGEVSCTAPEHFYAEVANALRAYVRAGRMRPAVAAELVTRCLELPLAVRPARDLVPAALVRGLQLELTVYDAAYVVLAEAAGAVLVTADRELAQAYERVELVS